MRNKAVNVLKQVSDKLTFKSPFVVIKNQLDLNARRNNLNQKKRISIAVPYCFKINHKYFTRQYQRPKDS